jgi:hypothetical protein
MIKSFNIFIALILWATACIAQQTNPQTGNSDWGKPVCDVQMSITLTNRVVAFDSPAILQCEIRNLSTNVISVQDTGEPIYDFNVSLISNSGKTTHLTPKNKVPRSIFMNLFVGINPNKSYTCDIPLSLDSTIVVGAYEIEVTRAIMVKKKRYVLVSNLLNVQIK